MKLFAFRKLGPVLGTYLNEWEIEDEHGTLLATVPTRVEAERIVKTQQLPEVRT